MRIWVDAEAAPRDVREVVCRASERLGVGAVFVGGQGVEPPGGYPLVEVLAEGSLDSLAEPGDVVVTADPLVAARLVPRGVASLDMRGTEHTAASIEEEQAVSGLLATLRSRGAAGRGPPPYDGRAKRDFAAALDRILTRLHRNGGS